MRTNRLLPAAALIALTALLAAPVTAASAEPSAVRTAERPVGPGQPLVPMIDVQVADFAAEAATLPAALEGALARDAGISGAEWLAQAEASAVGIEVVDALAQHIEVRDARLDGLELVVTVGSVADVHIVESVGARAEIGPAAARSGDPIEGLLPVTDLRGGMPYAFNSNLNRCSIGFVGLDVVTLQTQMLSAGHCEGDGLLRQAQSINRPTLSGGTASGPTQLIGDAGLHVVDEHPNPGFFDDLAMTVPTRTYYDLGITPVTGSNWSPKPEVVTWGGSTTGAPLASDPLVIRDAGSALVGSTICKSGSTSGWTCGAITFVDEINEVGASGCPATTPAYCVGSIRANICVRSGDSGGPAMVGSRAVGITSAATNGNATSCSGTGNVGVFATLYSQNAAWEQVAKVYPNWEPLIGLRAPTISTGGLNRFDATLAGSLTGAGVRHDVALALDQGATLTDEVNAAGAWGIDIDAVPSGTRSYTLRSSWGSGVQQSTTTTGRFLKASQSRLFASDRYGTSVSISQSQFPGSDGPTTPVAPGVPVVYLANGSSFADALSAGPAAALEGGPLLLSPSRSLPAVVAAELDRLNPETIVIVGGTGVVTSAVASAAAAYATNPVVRLGGASRYETSRKIAERMLTIENGLATGADLWVATGRNFPDALSAGAAASSQGVPILLVNGSSPTLDSTTATFINTVLQSDTVYIAGGTGVVSPGIQTAITNLLSTSPAVRAGGADRFATSLAINRAAYPVSAPQVFLAYAYNFPDALSGSVVAGLRGGPLYISQTSCVASSIVDHILDLGPSQVTVFGGTTIVSDNARDLRRC